MTDLDKVSFLQRYILVHSYLYYHMNMNIVEDRVYDLKSKELVALQSQIDVSKTDYGYVYYDYDGTTGFDLYDRLNDQDKEKI